MVYTPSGVGMIIDPGCSDSREERKLSSFIDEQGLTPALLINTHCHIDHVMGNHWVSRQYGIRVHIPRGEVAVLQSAPRVAQLYGLSYTHQPDVVLIEGNKVFLDGETFELLQVPGHSPGHIALYHRDQGLLFSGDVLFRESIGRTDLPGGDMDTLMNSIRNELYCLPDDTVVYPGHMEPTTIGHEKRHNPFVRV